LFPYSTLFRSRTILTGIIPMELTLSTLTLRYHFRQHIKKPPSKTIKLKGQLLVNINQHIKGEIISLQPISRYPAERFEDVQEFLSVKIILNFLYASCARCIR